MEVVKLLCSSSPRCINKSAMLPVIFNIRKLLWAQIEETLPLSWQPSMKNFELSFTNLFCTMIQFWNWSQGVKKGTVYLFVCISILWHKYKFIQKPEIPKEQKLTILLFNPGSRAQKSWKIAVTLGSWKFDLVFVC